MGVLAIRQDATNQKERIRRTYWAAERSDTGQYYILSLAACPRRKVATAN